MESPSSSQRILVLLSGSGTNFAALLAAIRSGALPGATIVHVLSNRKNAYGLTRASDAGIPTTYHNLVKYKNTAAQDEAEARQRYDSDLAKLIIAQKPDIVVCAGWMHILSPSALDPVREAGIDIINVHPALPGQFDGKDAIQRAWTAFKNGKIKETGIMIHHVIHTVDRGEPIVVRKIPMKEGESLEELVDRIHSVEHEAIVEGTKIVLSERIGKKDSSR